jgi:cyanate permease
MLIAEGADSNRPNHPKSIRMALIASLTFNIGVGSIMGTPGVLLPHMKAYLGVSTEMASAGLLAAMVASAVFAPMIGALAARFSLRWVLGIAALLLAGAWTLLGLSRSYPLYMLAYGLMFGPTMAVVASVLPPTLVTRWFNRNRGLAIGLVHLPIMVAIMPLATEWLISHIGLQHTFGVLAVLPLVTLLPAALLLIDWPPEAELPPVTSAIGSEPAADQITPSEPHGHSLTILQLLSRPRFWALSLAAAMPNTSSTLLGLHLVSMAESWHIAPLAAAGLASIMSLVGMVGAVAMGFVADRIGGARALALISACDAVLWMLFLTGLPYAGLAAVIGLIGLFGSGCIPSICKAFAENFGRATFSRAIGLMVPISLPLLFAGLIGPGMAVRIHGNYTPVVLVMACGFVLTALLAAFSTRPVKGTI